MTASASPRLASLCHTSDACSPRTALVAWNASWSEFDPGKTMTANFIASPSPPSPAPGAVSQHFHPIALDHGVRQQLGRHLGDAHLGGAAIGRVEFDLEELPLPHVAHVVV